MLSLLQYSILYVDNSHAILVNGLKIETSFERNMGMTNDMTKGSPSKLLLYFSIPILIGNLFQQLYNMVDTIIVGKAISTDALAAVGLTGPLSFLILGFVLGITGGFAVVVAQNYGAKDEQGVKQSVANSLVLCIAFTIILTAFAVLTTHPLLKLMNTPENIYKDAYVYIIIIYIGIGCNMLYNMVACIIRALGDSKTPLYFLALSSVVNIVLDLVFILVFGWGVAGAAIATIIAQGLSGVLCLIYANVKYPILHLRKEHFVITRDSLRKHLGIGLPMAFQFSITAVGVIILQSALNTFGSQKIAAFTAASKVEQLVTQPASTFGTAIATYTGQNLGANNPKRIKEGVRQMIFISLGFCVLSSAIVFLFGEALTSLFVRGHQPEVIASATMYLNILAISFPMLNLLYIYRNALQGMGKSFVPLMAGVSELVMRSLVAFLLPAFMGYTAICLASPIAWLGAMVPLMITYYVVIHRVLSGKERIYI